MPSKSTAQHKAMLAAAYDPKAAKKLKIPQSVAQEYIRADRRKKAKFR